MAHLFTWRYHSHTLREGLADYRLVRFLVERSGMERFLKVYDASEPETEMSRVYGASREELVRLAVTGAR